MITTITPEVLAELPPLPLADRSPLGRSTRLHGETKIWPRPRAFCADIPCGRIIRIRLDGSFELFARYDGEPNGLCIHKDGRVFIAVHERGIMILAPVTPAVISFVTEIEGKPMIGPNDLIRPNRRRIRLNPEGGAEILIERLAAPNGLRSRPLARHTLSTCFAKKPFGKCGG